MWRFWRRRVQTSAADTGMGRRAMGRREMVRHTRRAASADASFQAAMAAADRARDAADWALAAQNYRQGLVLYPLHGGYHAQLGHVLKEQGLFLSAEIAYRNAICLGEIAESAHLAFVVERAGRVFDRIWLDRVVAYWRSEGEDLGDIPPTQQDVADAIELFCNRGMPGEPEIRDLMAGCAARRDLLARLLAGDEFRHYHADLLRYIEQTGWGRR